MVRAFFASLLPVAIFAMLPGRADASCAAPPPEISWTFPAAGATDVPTNSLIWVQATNVFGGDPHVWLDGVALPRAPIPFEDAFAPGATFAPQSTHTLHIVVDADRTEFTDGGPLDVEDFSFTTGDAPAPAPVIASASTVEVDGGVPLRPNACGLAFQLEDCFDTPPYRDVFLEVSPGAVAYQVDSKDDQGRAGIPFSWPGTCGAPFTEAHSQFSTCFTVHAFNAAGEAASSEPLCVDKPGPLGCAQPGGLAPLAFLAALAVAARRRDRGRSA